MAEDREIEEFIRLCIPSVWALELLLVLQRDPNRYWRPFQLVGELRASTKLVDDILTRFERQGLVLKDRKGWRFAAGPNPARLAEKLGELYRRRPMHTIELIVGADSR